MDRKLAVVLISVVFSVIAILNLPYVYAEVVSVTVDLQTILLEPNQIIPLLDTKTAGNMTKLQISATLPCESNNTPKLKIFVGALGKLTSVIDSSSDYKNLRGPFNTCYYEDIISPSSSTPIINKVFLNNTGSSSVVTNLGSIITLTGSIASNQTSTSGLIFSDNFSGYATQTQADAAWPTSDAAKMRVNISNQTLDFHHVFDNTEDVIVHDLGSVVSNEKWLLRMKVRLSNIVESPSNQMFIGLSNSAEQAHPITDTQSQIYFGITQTATTKGLRTWDSYSATLNQPDNTTNLTWQTNTDYYIELIRSSTTTYQANVFSNAAFTQILASASGTVDSANINLRFIKISNNFGTGESGQIRGVIDDVKFWNGVTAPS